MSHNSQQSKGTPNFMVDQRPKYDSKRQVYSRKLKVMRPTLKRKKVKFL